MHAHDLDHLPGCFQMRMSFDSVAEYHDKTRGPPMQVMEQLVKKLINELCGYKTILDAGVGTGRFAKPLQDNGFDALGIDIAEKMINKAVEKGAKNLHALSDRHRNFSFNVQAIPYLLEAYRESFKRAREANTEYPLSFVNPKKSLGVRLVVY